MLTHRIRRNRHLCRRSFLQPAEAVPLAQLLLQLYRRQSISSVLFSSPPSDLAPVPGARALISLNQEVTHVRVVCLIA